jgi:inosose dehydratase
MKYTRTQFLKLAGGAITGAVAWTGASGFSGTGKPAKTKFKLGLASYTFRAFNLDDTIAMANRLQLTGISLKSMHMPLEDSPEQIKATAKKVRDSGLDLYGAGVIYMKNQQEVDTAFAYAAAAGLEMIIGVPNHELLDSVEEKVKQTNIKLAIHNHGPGDKLYSSPDDVYEKIKNLDKRIGFCIDIGHVRRIGQDPAGMIGKYKDRIYDIHMKDEVSESAENTPTEIGHGMINIPKVLKTIERIGYAGYLAFEYEKDEKDPLPGLAESVGYVRGVIRMLS